jgi:uracil-DNA glycosylase
MLSRCCGWSARDPKQESAEQRRPLLRVFCHAYGNKIILLLGGYDKGSAPSAKRQNEEIRIARQRLTEFRRRQAGSS